MPNQMILFDFIQNRIDVKLVVMGEVPYKHQNHGLVLWQTLALHFRLKPYRLFFIRAQKRFLDSKHIRSQYKSIYQYRR
jgi:hypothetical protein